MFWLLIYPHQKVKIYPCFLIRAFHHKTARHDNTVAQCFFFGKFKLISLSIKFLSKSREQGFTLLNVMTYTKN